MDKFWELFKDSYIVQAVIALVLVVTIVYLYVTHQDVPEALINFVALILGFYFGSKSQQTLKR